MTIKNKDKQNSFKLLKKIYLHLDVKKRKEIQKVFILSLFSSLAESVSIAMLIPFISFFINAENYLFNNFFNSFFELINVNTKKEIFLVISLCFIFIVLLSSLIKIKYIKLTNYLSEHIASDFRIKIFNFLINQDYSYHFKYGSNEILSNLSQKSGLFTAIIFSTLNIFNAYVITIGIFSILIYNEPIYTPIIIGSILLFFLVIFKIRSSGILKRGQVINLKQNIMIDIFQNSVGYLPEIIIYNLRSFFLKLISKTSLETAASGSEIKTISMTPRVYLETFIIIVVVLLVSSSAFANRTIEANISYIAILAFAAQKCLPLINNIYQTSIRFKSLAPAVTSFLNILEKQNKNLFIETNNGILLFNDSISINNISFRYEENLPYILKNVTFNIKKGKKIVIRGETGSGKSTLVNIISGLFIPSDGKILIDGIEINSSNINNWQKNIAVVPQNIFLTDETIFENIAIAESKESINIKKVIESAKKAQIDEFVNTLPNKYYQKVGEKGIRLSGGQKQRIGIARALYRQSNLIILDEPTNALDQDTEKLVMESIADIDDDITIIMVTHSTSSFKYFDEIIDLDKYK